MDSNKPNEVCKASDILADLHTHTVFSKHAYSTVKENVEAAKKRGIKYLAITDHLYNLKSPIEMKNMASRIAYQDQSFEMEKEIRIIGGMEMNIDQYIDVSESNLKKMSKAAWRLIGLHSWYVDLEKTGPYDVYDKFKHTLDGKCLQYNENLLKPTAFAHIEREIEKLNRGFHVNGDGRISDDIREMLKSLVDLAHSENIILELNESSLRNKCYENAIRFWLAYAKEKKCIICLGTDAHYCESVGIFDKCINMLNEVGYEKDKILNCNLTMLEERFGKVQ